MTRTLIVVASVLCLAVPAALAAPPDHAGKPDKKKATSQAAEQPGQSGQNAAQECQAERSRGEDAFKARYGTNGNKANAFGKCVSSKSKSKSKSETETEDKNESSNESKAEQNAAKKCKAERALDESAFKARYGTNHNKANAFGKCVSKLAKAKHSS